MLPPCPALQGTRADTLEDPASPHASGAPTWPNSWPCPCPRGRGRAAQQPLWEGLRGLPARRTAACGGHRHAGAVGTGTPASPGAPCRLFLPRPQDTHRPALPGGRLCRERATDSRAAGPTPGSRRCPQHRPRGRWLEPAWSTPTALPAGPAVGVSTAHCARSTEPGAAGDRTGGSNEGTRRSALQHPTDMPTARQRGGKPPRGLPQPRPRPGHAPPHRATHPPTPPTHGLSGKLGLPHGCPTSSVHLTGTGRRPQHPGGQQAGSGAAGPTGATPGTRVYRASTVTGPTGPGSGRAELWGRTRDTCTHPACCLSSCGRTDVPTPAHTY